MTTSPPQPRRGRERGRGMAGSRQAEGGAPNRQRPLCGAARPSSAQPWRTRPGAGGWCASSPSRQAVTALSASMPVWRLVAARAVPERGRMQSPILQSRPARGDRVAAQCNDTRSGRPCVTFGEWLERPPGCRPHTCAGHGSCASAARFSEPGPHPVSNWAGSRGQARSLDAEDRAGTNSAWNRDESPYQGPSGSGYERHNRGHQARATKGIPG